MITPEEVQKRLPSATPGTIVTVTASKHDYRVIEIHIAHSKLRGKHPKGQLSYAIIFGDDPEENQALLDDAVKRISLSPQLRGFFPHVR